MPDSVIFPNGFYVDDRLMTPGLAYRAYAFIDAEFEQKGKSIDPRLLAATVPDFRAATASALNNLSDEEVASIIRFTVQRLRMIRTLWQLRTARYKYATIGARFEGDQFPICLRMRDKYFRVAIAVSEQETFAQLTVEEQATIIRKAEKRALDESFSSSFGFEGYDRNVVPDSLLWQGLGRPPFHRFCTCEIEGVEKEEVEANEPPPLAPRTLTIQLKR